MERFGQVTEGSNPSSEWTGPGTKTGLEEPIMHLRLGGARGGGGSGESGGGATDSYPERPDEPDCIYYLRTGFCGYGVRCRFNHPADPVALMETARASGGEYPERLGQPVCQCEKECSYYVKTGQCKFGATCKFHHPQPADVQAPPRSLEPQLAPPPIPGPAVYPTMQPQRPVPNSQQYGVIMARPHLVQSSYVQGPYGPMLLSPGMVPIPGWSPYPQSGSPLASPNTQQVVGSSLMYGITQLSLAYTQAYQHVPSPAGPSNIINQNEQPFPFPERPGLPECQFYMKTGDCKFGTSCRYHHPSDPTAQKSNIILNPVGLPMRPGAQPCSHYAQRGVCKFGPTCKFDHPIGGGALIYSPSASSLADMPVAPYPMGSSVATLAPSSASSDLRPEIIPGPTRMMSSSIGAPSGSVGPIFVKSLVPNNSNEQQQTVPSTATTKTEVNQAKEV